MPAPGGRKTGFTRSNQAGFSGQGGQTPKNVPDALTRTPPHNLDAERAVLGGVLSKPNALVSILDVLQAEDFYFPAHTLIFQAFIDLYEKSAPPDVVSVAELLHAEKTLDQSGGPAYLAELQTQAVGAAYLGRHAAIVRDKAILRKLIDVCNDVRDRCFESPTEIGELLDESEQVFFQVTQRLTGKSFDSAKQMIDQVFKDLEKRTGRGELITGVSTGYHKLNEMTAGFQPSDLIIIAGRPSMGKTAFALNVGLRAAVMHQKTVAVFSLEMSKDQLMQRMLCSWGHVDLARLRKGFLDDNDWMRLYNAANDLTTAPIYIDDTPAISTLEMRARCRRLANQGLSMVIVDYLQLMRASKRIESREQEISEISRSLKALAKELQIPVIALSQLNRKVEERTNRRPMLSDLRESGAIEQDADVIIFLYRDEVYNKKEDNPKKGIAEIIIGKQRNGPIGDIELAYLGYCTAFEELAHQTAPADAATG